MATASRIPQQVRLMHRPPAALKMRAAFHHPQLIQIIICWVRAFYQSIIALIEGEPCHD
jgi:hypothetical protein